MIKYFRLINLMNYQQINFSRVSAFSHETKRHTFLNKNSYLPRVQHEGKLMERMCKPFIDAKLT